MPWDLRIFSKNIDTFLGHMIHEIGPEFSQDHEYAVEKILRPLVQEFLPKKTVIRLGLTRLKSTFFYCTYDTSNRSRISSGSRIYN